MKEMHSINKQWSEIYLGEKRKTLNESECEFCLLVSVWLWECITVSVSVWSCISGCIWASVGVYVCVWFSVCVRAGYSMIFFHVLSTLDAILWGGWRPKLKVVKWNEETLDGVRKHLAASSLLLRVTLDEVWVPPGVLLARETLGIFKDMAVLLVAAQGLTEDWGLGLGSPPCGPHAGCWSSPHKATASVVFLNDPTHSWSSL
jgi:hypothetical protein